jgi:glyoxylase-like metal-dependent hydrolase (beta-lactamase superfamily II)
MFISVFAIVYILFPLVSSASNKNEVVVITEGYVKAIEGRQLIPGTSDDGARHIAGTVALIKGDGVVVVADPGMVTDRNLIVNGIKKNGILPEDVTHVFISHHHPDHTVNIALFPNAEVIDFWGIYKGDFWRDHPDGYEIASGIKVLQTPGHTKEDATLMVETSNGTYAFTHLWWTQDKTPEKDPIAWDQKLLDENRNKIDKIADWVIPGHGKMFDNRHSGEK